MMVTYGKDFGGPGEPPESPSYVRPMESNVEILIRILGVVTAIIVCGVGADIAYHRHVMGYYVTVASALIFFLEITWAITLFVQICLSWTVGCFISALCHLQCIEPTRKCDGSRRFNGREPFEYKTRGL
ncbi:uncharacterized protein LOC135171469 isoform X3 [Diachasmimorpha longicaudata]|uniref:uncharacterized protein LOC135171469 isoform X3 n=1 Tax=Diachasmimorpha longicaudata TaxID=58733 RepID=UPI0030B8E0A9